MFFKIIFVSGLLSHMYLVLKKEYNEHIVDVFRPFVKFLRYSCCIFCYIKCWYTIKHIIDILFFLSCFLWLSTCVTYEYKLVCKLSHVSLQIDYSEGSVKFSGKIKKDLFRPPSTLEAVVQKAWVVDTFIFSFDWDGSRYENLGQRKILIL